MTKRKPRGIVFVTEAQARNLHALSAKVLRRGSGGWIVVTARQMRAVQELARWRPPRKRK